MTEKMRDCGRDEFEKMVCDEADVRGQPHTMALLKDSHDRYAMIWVQTSWLAWQASRAPVIAERDHFKAESELAAIRIKELDLLFGRYLLAMRSALIEEEHGKGPAAAMEWIYNSLAGPGELPPEGETDSQAYFDREIIAVDRGMGEVMAFHEMRRAAMKKEGQP